MQLLGGNAALVAQLGYRMAAAADFDYPRWLSWFAGTARADATRLSAISARPRGLSLILPAGANQPAALALTRQAQASGASEVVIAKDQAAHKLTIAAQAARFSHLCFLPAQGEPGPDFIDGMLTELGVNAITLPRLAPADTPAALTQKRHFAPRLAQPSSMATRLAPLLLAPVPIAFPAEFLDWLNLVDTAPDLSRTLFVAQAVAMCLPEVRSATGTWHLIAPATKPALFPQIEALALLEDFDRHHPHPFIDTVTAAIATDLRAAFASAPVITSWREARRLEISGQTLDRAFGGLCLAGNPAGNPAVSIIIPVHNAAEDLDRCLTSVLAQDMPDFEVLAVDDGSTDDSLAVLLHHARDARVRVFAHASPRGPGGARNTALKQASGSWLSFVDSDDHVAPDFLSHLCAGTRNGHFDIVVCGAQRVTPDGAHINTWDTDIRAIDPIPDGADRLTLLTPTLMNKLWGAKLFAGRTFVEGMYFQDAAIGPSLVRAARRINRIGGVRYNYVQREGSITQSVGPRHLMDYLRLFDTVKDGLIADGRYPAVADSFKAWVEGHCRYHIRHVTARPPDADKSAYLRHFRLMTEGYLASDDALRMHNPAISDLMTRDAGLS